MVFAEHTLHCGYKELEKIYGVENIGMIAILLVPKFEKVVSKREKVKLGKTSKTFEHSLSGMRRNLF
jgi:hypothetical protein